MPGYDDQQSQSFASLKLPMSLQTVISELGFTAMTPIQAQSIPLLLQGRDLIGQSKTGSGKTAAFSLPILSRLDLSQRRFQALILCPTRELCTQVAREIRRLGSRLPGLQVLILSGGQPIRPQMFSLEKGAHIAVGTPGRILDHLQRQTLSLSDLRWLVLDEADRMLDMGFQDDMEVILSKAPQKRQTVFFSATFPQSITAMTAAYQKDPVTIKVEHNEADQPKISEIIYEVERDRKPIFLQNLLCELQPQAAMIFCNQKLTTAELAEKLCQLSGKTASSSIAAAIHGDMLQQDRDLVMAKFRNGSIRILVATDVAARGIDIQDLDLVINYDLPKKTDVYVHRIGRTGRAGKTGMAVSFIAPGETYLLERIESYIKRPLKLLKADELGFAQQAGREHALQAKMTTLEISGGRKDKLRPTDILGALTGDAAGLDGAHIGKIEIHDRFAYVAVSCDVAQLAVDCLRQGRIKGRRFQIVWHR
ncbi:MAG: ATP-dependent RNA helicase DbpA [Oligoflexus sp.]